MTDKDTDDKPAFFVSRRGRKVGMHEVDLGGIDIDSEASENEVSQPAPPKQPKASKPAKTVQREKRTDRKSKRLNSSHR